MALYHTAKGSVNYTIVGSPTIVNGVASGFSRNDYLGFSSNFPGASIETLELQFALPAGGAANSTIFDPSYSDTAFRFGYNSGGALIFYRNNKIYYTNRNATSYKYINIVSLNDGNAPTLTVSNNGTDWTNLYIGNTVDGTLYARNEAFTILSNNYARAMTLDLNYTYIKVNGQPWFGVCPVEVKKHQLRGPVGYTVVGSPTIVDGVASGFSDSNYLTLTSNLPTSGVKTLEVFSKFTPSTTSRQDILAQNNYYSQLGMWIDGAAKLHTIAYMGQGSPGYTEIQVGSIQAGHTYYGKLIVSTETREISLSISEDKQNWTTATKTASRDIVINNASYRIGKADVGAFDGSIDLNETYIKVNGKLWFYQPAPTKYIIREDKDTHDQSLVFASQDLYLSGPNNYTVVGSPVIEDGIASGFSGSDYLKLPFFGQNLITDFEMNTECRLSSTTSGQQQQTLFGSYNSTYGVDEYRVLIWDNGGNSGSIYVRLVDYTDPDNITLRYTTVLSGVAWGTYLKINLSCVNSQATVVVKDENDTVLANMAISHPVVLLPMSSGENPSIGTYRSSYAWKGSIDLKNTYIKINGSLWFYGKNYATKNIAPVPAGYHTKGQVGCTAVGSPTITDGAVSGFSNDNYLTLNNVFNPGNYNWEFCTKVNPTLTGAASYIISRSAPTYRSGFGIALGTSSDTRAILNLSSDGSSNDIANGERGSHNYSQNTNYWMKLRFTGTQYILSYSLDDITYIDDITIDSSTPIYGANGFLAIGVNRYTTTGNIQPFGGSIDLNNTYIKVNNKMWFDGSAQYPFTGYVDMRTQAFTAAPTGATIGRDE